MTIHVDMQAWPPHLTRALLSNPVQLSSLCSALVQCFDFSPSAAALLLYANPQPGPYASLPSGQGRLPPHRPLPGPSSTVSPIGNGEHSPGQPAASSQHASSDDEATLTTSPSIPSSEPSTSSSGPPGLTAFCQHQNGPPAEIGPSPERPGKAAPETNGTHRRASMGSEQVKADGITSVDSHGATPANGKRGQAGMVSEQPVAHSFCRTESRADVEANGDSRGATQANGKQIASNGGQRQDGLDSERPMASVLLPRMPAGLELLSGQGSYEAVASVAWAMGRTASAQPGMPCPTENLIVMLNASMH